MLVGPTPPSEVALMWYLPLCPISGLSPVTPRSPYYLPVLFSLVCSAVKNGSGLFWGSVSFIFCSKLISGSMETNTITQSSCLHHVIPHKHILLPPSKEECLLQLNCEPWSVQSLLRDPDGSATLWRLASHWDRRNMGNHVLALKASIEKWHTSIPLMFHWPKHVTWPYETQGSGKVPPYHVPGRRYGTVQCPALTIATSSLSSPTGLTDTPQVQ